MFRSHHTNRAVLAGLAILIGGVGIWLWSTKKAYAIGATQSDKVLMCAVPLDERGSESVWLLDALTGHLRAFQMHPVSGMYNAMFFRNVSEDFELSKIKGTPQFTMVPTTQRFQTRVGPRPIPAIVHIAEATTGKMVAYTVNWNSSVAARPLKGAPPGPIGRLDRVEYRGDVVRNPTTP